MRRRSALTSPSCLPCWQGVEVFARQALTALSLWQPYLADCWWFEGDAHVLVA